MHTVEITLEQVLLARDRRVLRQRELAARYGGTLLSFTMNIAGPVKDAPWSAWPFRRALRRWTGTWGSPCTGSSSKPPPAPRPCWSMTARPPG